MCIFVLNSFIRADSIYLMLSCLIDIFNCLHIQVSYTVLWHVLFVIYTVIRIYCCVGSVCVAEGSKASSLFQRIVFVFYVIKFNVKVYYFGILQLWADYLPNWWICEFIFLVVPSHGPGGPVQTGYPQAQWSGEDACQLI